MIVISLAIIALAFAAKQQRVGAPPPVNFPERYFVEGVFQIPYFQTKEPITAWTDVVNDMQKIEYYGGTDTYLYRYDDDLSYEIVPIVDQFGCFATNISGPMTGSNGKYRDTPQQPQVLPLVPDISSWSYNGTAVVRGIPCDAWQFIVTNVTAYGTGVSYYTMFVNNGSPVRLLMQGINFIMGSHPDVYIFDYHQFNGKNFSSDVFDVPDICNNNNLANTELLQRRAAHRLGAIHQSLGRVVPPMHTYMDCKHDVEDEFHAFTLHHHKRYKSCAEHEHRQRQYTINKQFVERWNADATNTHTVELNHLADLSDEEYRSLILMPKSPVVTERRLRGLASATHKFDMSAVKGLPSAIDWRVKGAVTPVKDQGACGSCWTFGSAGSLEGVNFVKNGKLISLSEQNINDCAWGVYGNAACDGGEAPGAYQFLMDNGGMGTETSYPYLAQDGWCNVNDHSSGVVVKGYTNITGIPMLQAAVASAPVSIAIDASLPSLRFYKSGTYADPACKNGVDDLDHEVLAVGYGTDQQGVNYWIVKNSWSTWWGNQGYFNLKIDGNVCGAATAATQPIV